MLTRARADIKEELRGRETEILRAAGINWPRPGAQHINCPFPNHDDRNPSWRWDDHRARFFCTCSEGSIIDAVMAMRGGTFLEASDWCREILGLAQPAIKAAPSPDIQLATFRHTKHGMPSAFWRYHDAKGQLAGVAARYETEKGKEIVPWIPDGGKWRAKAMPTPRPLYRLPQLVARKDAPVLIVEGEKTADKAAELFPDHAVTTNAGGCKAWKQSDWTPLAGRTVVIWPDNDDPGRIFAKNVAERALKDGAKSVAVVEMTEQWPEKWDIADELPPIFFPQDLEEMLAEARPVHLTGRKERSGAEEILSAGKDERPLIIISAGQLAAMADKAEDYLLAANTAFFRRSDYLVRPVVDEVYTSTGRKIWIPRLKIVSDTYLHVALSRQIRFEKFDKRANDFVAADAPKELAAAINCRSGEWRFSPISGIISTPTLRADGSLVIAAGYDAATGLLLVNPPRLPDMPEHPTRYDAEDGLNLLKELLVDFPFADDISRAVALSALITPVLRGGLGTAPMHVTSAPQAGSGKSYLFDIASAISIGQPCPVMAAGKTEEELDKRLGSALMAGQPIISIDNVNGDLSGASLCQAIERPMVAVRVLGKSEMPLVQNRATFFATGNNIRLVADLTRRALLCSLDSGEERPELREFKGKPAETVLAERGPYIAACLNIVRAYNAAGRPGCLPALASFETWSDTVRSALVWLGEADPVQSMERARESDPRREEISTFLAAFAEEIGTGSSFKKTAAQIIKAAEAKELSFQDGGGMRETGEPAHPLLKEAVENVSRDGKPNSRSLGKWLSGHMNVVHHKLKLRQWSDDHHGHKFFVEQI